MVSELAKPATFLAQDLWIDLLWIDDLALKRHPALKHQAIAQLQSCREKIELPLKGCTESSVAELKHGRRSTMSSDLVACRREARAKAYANQEPSPLTVMLGKIARRH